ncbi:hypothetical protein HK405_007596 [Cladochytrium tenue]|nr:hypothetical protein HK405_007596 [Cladochytrium tenue]
MTGSPRRSSSFGSQNNQTTQPPSRSSAAASSLSKASTGRKSSQSNSSNPGLGVDVFRDLDAGSNSSGDEAVVLDVGGSSVSIKSVPAVSVQANSDPRANPTSRDDVFHDLDEDDSGSDEAVVVEVGRSSVSVKSIPTLSGQESGGSTGKRTDTLAPLPSGLFVEDDELVGDEVDDGEWRKGSDSD